MKHFLIFITGMMLFLQHGKAQQDLEVSSIFVNPQITACDLQNKDVYVVLRSVTAQSIDFGTYPTGLKVEIQGQSIFYPLTHNIPGNSSDTVLVVSNVSFAKGIHTLKAYLSTPIDGNSFNDTIILALSINPNISLKTSNITGETFDCLAKGASVQQRIWVKNTGNMALSEIAVKMEISDMSQLFFDTIQVSLLPNDSAYIDIAYIVPSMRFYFVDITAYLACDSASINHTTAIRKCVDMDDLILNRIIKPQGTTDYVGEDKEIEVEVINDGYYSYTNIVLTATIEDTNGILIDNLVGVISNIDPLDAIYYRFNMKYTVPNLPSYFIRVFLSNHDIYPENDTILLQCYAIPIITITTTISGEIMRQDSTRLSAGVVELYKLPEYSLIDSVLIESDGTYSFTDVEIGTYTVKTIAESAENAAPTYYGNTEFWNLVNTVTVADTTPIQQVNITIISLNPLIGNSLISGYVGEDSNRQKSLSQKSVSNPAENVNVYLQTEQSGNWTTIAQTLTNSEGYFEFGNLPAGRYKVMLEILGLLHSDSPQIVEINDGDTIKNIKYEITDNGIKNKSGDEVGIVVGIGQTISLRVYPNPTTSKLIIKNEELTIENIEIYDIVGRLIQSKIVNLQSEIILDVSHLAKGLYYLKLNDKTVKFVKE